MPPSEETNRNKQTMDSPAELESQCILRLPPTPAASLRAAVRSGVMNLKDRLTIQLEPDMRHGLVKFDKFYMSAKVVDLPCLIESHKTLDRKTFYKTADICQLVVCREEEEGVVKVEEESPKKKERKDSKDKKFLWPHGITPSLKNVRKRRFRKTLKKKYVDFPEIEKEVKRLFRQDNEAIHVRYEVVNADDEKGESRFSNQDASNGVSMSRPRNINSNSQSLDVAEHDIFGEVLSSSEEDDVNIVDSADDDTSRMFSGNSQPHNRKIKPRDFVTEFSKGMLDSPGFAISDQSQDQDYPVEDNEAAAAASASETLAAEQSLNQLVKNEHDNSAMLMVKLGELEQEISNIQARRHAQEMDIATIENQALKQRFQNIIDNLKSEEAEKQHQYEEILSLLNQS